MSSQSQQEETIVVNVDDLIQLDKVDGPYLKHIELVKLTPRNFGLTDWTRLFQIPDNMMRRIYRDEKWKDTEVVKETITEVMSNEQREVLKNWLTFESPCSNFIESIRYGGDDRRSKIKIPEGDDLLKQLWKPLEEVRLARNNHCDITSNGCDLNVDHDSDASQPTLIDKDAKIIKKRTTKSAKIPVLAGHKVQPEHKIVEKAIEKMNHLSPEKEAEIVSLLKDEEYMQFLRSQIQIYLKNTGVLA